MVNNNPIKVVSARPSPGPKRSRGLDSVTAYNQQSRKLRLFSEFSGIFSDCYCLMPCKANNFTTQTYRALRNGYISNSKTFESVSVTASVTVINSEKTKVGICSLTKHLITDKITDFPELIADWVTDIPNGLLGFGWGPAIITNYMSVTNKYYGISRAKSVSVTPFAFLKSFKAVSVTP